ncbi:hypothetical protein AB1Y20_004271 [Prymnesium parvum]|uniref:EGF-like domain-containing protein n=1 Tax=Prymnesium parvum TaxID=97485 RepID=A0AB34J8W1_PRYPA
MLCAFALLPLEGFVGFRRSSTALEAPPCLSECSGHGVCERGACLCAAGWRGDACAQESCAHGCHGRGECVGGACVCAKGFGGADCAMSTGCPAGCSSHGWCLAAAAAEEGRALLRSPLSNESEARLAALAGNDLCVCSAGWRGAACDVDTCPAHCNGRGACAGGACACDRGWSGEACGEIASPPPPPPPPARPRACPDDFDCSGNGVCVRGACVCREGLNGTRCEGKERPCPGGCAGHGRCVRGECVCALGYAGDDCGRSACAGRSESTPCYGRGSCECDVASHSCECRCHVGFKPPLCEENSCFEQCHAPAHGECVLGHCRCNAHWRGRGCGTEICPLGCSPPHGECRDGECVCTAEWTGAACDVSTCPHGCSAHGVCEAGTCRCFDAFKGADCSILKDSEEGRRECAERLCSGEDHGTCRWTDAGPCNCKPKWTGEDCSVTRCPDSCSGNGFCTDRGCSCNPGFSGRACEKTTCRHDCSGRGKCVAGSCVCEKGWASADCSVPLSPRRRHMVDVALPGQPAETSTAPPLLDRLRRRRRTVDAAEAGVADVEGLQT